MASLARGEPIRNMLATINAAQKEWATVLAAAWGPLLSAKTGNAALSEHVNVESGKDANSTGEKTSAAQKFTPATSKA